MSENRANPWTVKFDPQTSLAFDEVEQIDVDDFGLRRDHAVRVVLVGFQGAVLQKLAVASARSPASIALIVLRNSVIQDQPHVSRVEDWYVIDHGQVDLDPIP